MIAATLKTTAGISPSAPAAPVRDISPRAEIDVFSYKPYGPRPDVSIRAKCDGMVSYHYPTVRTLADFRAGDRVVVKIGQEWAVATVH